ncbi:MAG: TIGR00269 family protein [Desulfobacterota bacterium]|nr:TIGR00269 family protein [Thermodesulfobacteriota bacterium]MDW8001960.1 TIGR00269 family protein [Deltaproteobacteria bacterium]
MIKIRAYNTAFCSDHFLSFVERRAKETIRTFALLKEGESVLVAVSGGKDSLSLWHILKNLGYKSDGLYIHLGIDRYSDISLEKAVNFAKKIGGKLFVVRLKEIFEKGIRELSHTMRRKSCSACGTIKRYIMNRVALEEKYDSLATGHNLDDEASSLLGNLLYWKEPYLWKKNIALEAEKDRLSRKIKPFFLLSEREIAAYALLNGIDYVQDECPYSVGAKTLLYKEILNRIENESPGTKLNFVKGYLKRVEKETEDCKEKPSNYCRLCNYPSVGEKCAFCSLLQKINPDGVFKYEKLDFSL